MKKTRVKIIVDVRVPLGAYQVGGVRIVRPQTDADLGRELRTKEVRVPTQEAAIRMRDTVLEHPSLELVK